MNKLIKLSLLSTAFLLVGCNEKVSPELQDAASSSTVGVAVPPSTHYFRVVNATTPLAGYKLHKAGEGNLTTACQISQTSALTNTLYTTIPSTYPTASDINCFVEAEELSLWFTGLSLTVEASANTCEYIGYSPYSYYNRPAGSSTTSLTKVNCTNDTTTNADAALAGSPLKAGGQALCGEWVDTTLSAVARVAFSVPEGKEEELLCAYNYTDGNEEKCDIGKITVSELSVTFTPATGAAPSSRKSEVKTTTIDCGGLVSNCIKGPIKTSPIPDSTIMTEITDTTINSAFTKSYTYPRLQGQSIELANYRRELASLELNYINKDHADYKNSFVTDKNFTSLILDRYTSNKRMDGTTDLVTAAMKATVATINSGLDPVRKTLPISAEPFLGLYGYRTQPFYTFYCLDKAFDIKARIRLTVREWDRVFPENSSMELISDISKGANARQDIDPNFSVEIPLDNDSLNGYNDRVDWDNKIPMQRTDTTFTGYVPATTIWQPLVNGTYLNGFFNPANYPNDPN